MSLNTLSGGSFQDLSGNVLANGYLTFELSHDSQDTTTNAQICAGLTKKIPLDNNGNVAGSPSIENNDTLSPSGSYYIVNAYRADGVRAWQSAQYVTVVSGNSPFNLGTNVVPSQPAGSGSSGGSSPVSTYMLSAGVFDLITAPTSSLLVPWSDTIHRVNVLRFVLTASISGLTNIDGSFGSSLGGGSNFALGFYSTTGNLLWTSGANHIANVSNTASSFTVPSLTLATGVYYFAWTAEDSTNLTAWGWVPNSMAYHSGTSNGNVINQSTVFFGYAANASTSGPVLPSTLGALTAYSAANSFGVPAILFH